MRNNAMRCEHKEGYYNCLYAYRALKWMEMRWKVVVTTRAGLLNEIHNTNCGFLISKSVCLTDVLF